MQGTVFVVRDRDARPKPGQQVTLLRHHRAIAGTVRRFGGDVLVVSTGTPSLILALPAGTRLQVEAFTVRGVLRATVVLLSAQADEVTVQLLGLPELVQRRAHPRVRAELPVRLTWLDPIGRAVQVTGRTENVSLGGALLDLAGAPALPDSACPVLVDVTLPDGPASLPGQLVQAWDGGARVRFLSGDARAVARLAAFVDQLSAATSATQ